MKVNGDELLASKDDGAFMDVLKKYFSTLDESAFPNSTNPKARALTKFNELMLVAYKEFESVTAEMVAELRRNHQLKVVHNIGSFTKRSQLRNITPGKFSKDEMSVIYDRFYSALFYGRSQSGRGSSKQGEARALDANTFVSFLGSIAHWAQVDDDQMEGDEVQPINGSPQHRRRGSTSTTSTSRERRRVVGKHFISRLFDRFDGNGSGILSLQEVTTGLGDIIHGDMMSRMQLFFDMHDLNKDGTLNRDEILGMSESLLFIYRYDDGDTYLPAISNFIRNAFEFAEKVEPEKKEEFVVEDEDEEDEDDDSKKSKETKEGESGTEASSASSTPKTNGTTPQPQEEPEIQMSLPSFRMVVLADESLEQFFDSGFSGSFKLLEPLDRQRGLFAREVFDSLLSEGRKLAGSIAGGIQGRGRPHHAPSSSSSSSLPTADANKSTASISEKQDTDAVVVPVAPGAPVTAVSTAADGAGVAADKSKESHDDADDDLEEISREDADADGDDDDEDEDDEDGDGDDLLDEVEKVRSLMHGYCVSFLIVMTHKLPNDQLWVPILC